MDDTSKKRRHKNISLICPMCANFSLMPILAREREQGKVRYTVRCNSCKCVFEARHPWNLWREVKLKYKMPSAELRRLKEKVVRHVMMYGTAPEIEDTGAALFIGGELIAYRELRKTLN